MSVIWTGQNTEAVKQLLDEFDLVVEPDGSKLHLHGIGVNLHLFEGDKISVDGESLRIDRAKEPPKTHKFVTWTGTNIMEFDDFLKWCCVNIMTVGDRLNIYGGPNMNEVVASLGRGDRITKRANDTIVVTRAGQHHKV